VFFSVKTSDEYKRALIEYWLGKADESVASASSELNAGRLTFAVNRLYYALFYATTALLYSKSQNYLTLHTPKGVGFLGD
jgi:uncharacterized protein (UPF0332 family)